MKNKKITLIFALITLLLFSLSSCGKNRESNLDTNTLSQIILSENTNKINTKDLQKVTAGFMAIADIGADTEEGYYIINPIGNHYNIVYNDFKTKKAVFLCSAPNCYHENDACTAYSKVGGYLFITNENLYFLANDASLDSDKFEHILYEMDLNGENKHVVYKFAPEDVYMGSHIMASKDEKIYLAIEKADSNTKKLAEISLDSGKCRYVIDLDIGENIASAYQNQIYTIKPQNNFDSYSSLKLATEYGAYAIDVLAEEKIEVYTFDKLDTVEKKLNNDIVVQIPVQKQDYNIIEDSIYIYEYDKKQLYKININNQNKEIVVDLSEAILEPEPIWIDCYTKELIILYAVKSNRRFTVDLENNTFIENTLTTFGSKTNEKAILDPISIQNDVVIFYNGGKEYTINQTMKDGSEQQINTLFSELNIMTKEDYINNIEKFSAIENGEVFIKAIE